MAFIELDRHQTVARGAAWPAAPEAGDAPVVSNPTFGGLDWLRLVGALVRFAWQHRGGRKCCADCRCSDHC